LCFHHGHYQRQCPYEKGIRAALDKQDKQQWAKDEEDKKKRILRKEEEVVKQARRRRIRKAERLHDMIEKMTEDEKENWEFRMLNITAPLRGEKRTPLK
jgi:hypothetical protein